MVNGYIGKNWFPIGLIGARRNLVLSGLGTISISLDLSETFSGIGAANEIYIKIQFRKV